MNAKLFFPLIGLATFLAGCAAFGQAAAQTGQSASGTITVVSVQVAPEISGKIQEISVEKGSRVKVGDPLFKLDDQLLQAQKSQADAGVKAAQAGLEAAQQKLNSAQVQYNLALQASRAQNQADHTSAWKASSPDRVSLPVWYFEKSEQIEALNAQITAAQKDLDTESTNLTAELNAVSNKDFITTEKRLAEAQQAYAIARQTLDQAKAAKDTTDLVDAAQKILDSAQAELDAAQKSYDQMLSSDSSKRVREARARVAVARERLNITQDSLDLLQTGRDALQVTAAQTGVDLAKTGVSQAEAALSQAQATLQLVQVQLNKTAISSPVAGIVLAKPMNSGETAAVGATVIEIGTLDEVTLTVYIPENQYGKIHLNQGATVSVDSFAGRSFAGDVTYISDQAEFTPRNVQTTESRSATVYKVEISISNTSHELKPGMPADASFD